MVDNHAPRSGLLISALGSAVLAVSMFSPWYSVSVTPAGADEARQQLAGVAQQYGNTNLQNMADQVGAQFGSLAGRPLATVSAHEALKDLSTILLLLAGVALLASLLRLADVFEVSGGQIAVVGLAAALCVLYRMLSPPGVHTELISLSLSWGSWLALAAAAAIVGGGLWTPAAGQSSVSPAQTSGGTGTL
jgi:hypothetical protein